MEDSEKNKNESGNNSQQTAGTEQEDKKGSSALIDKQPPKTGFKKGRKGKDDTDEKKDSIDFYKKIDSLYEGRRGLNKIGYAYLLSHLSDIAGDSSKRTENIRVNPDIFGPVCDLIKEDFGVKGKEDQLEKGLLLLLYFGR